MIRVTNMGAPSDPQTQPYRPSNGTEGEDFYARNCARCLGERDYRESGYDAGELGCKILTASYAYGIDDPNYPKEWVRDEGPWELSNPRCTAFVEDHGQTIPPPRCTETPDLFGDV